MRSTWIQGVDISRLDNFQRFQGVFPYALSGYALWTLPMVCFLLDYEEGIVLFISKRGP